VIYQNVMGIETDDIITMTNPDGGPYVVVSMTRPRYTTQRFRAIFAYEHPIFSIVLGFAPGHHRYGKDNLGHDSHWLNEVVCVDGVYTHHYSGYKGRRLIHVQKPDVRPVRQVDMFSSQLEPGPPHPFRDDVDYSNDRHNWHCVDCALDFNSPPGPRTNQHYVQPALCTRCGFEALRLFRMRFGIDNETFTSINNGRREVQV